MKKILVLLMVSIFIFSLAACTANEAKAKEDGAAAPTNEAASKIEVTDLQGNVTVFDTLPERIVSLSPSNTEILFDLGAGSKVVGVTNYCNYPEEVNNIEKIGDFEGANIELIKKVNPDVVLAGGYIQEDLINSLKGLGIPVVSTEALDLNGIYDSIRIIAKVTGTETKGEEIITDMQAKIKAVQEKTAGKQKPKVFYVVWTDPITTAGSDTFINDIIKIAGGINVAEKVSNWAKYSQEQLLADNPDILIASNYSTPEAVSKDYYKNSSTFNNLDSVKNDKIYIVSNDDIFSRATPRIVQAIEELEKVFYEE